MLLVFLSLHDVYVELTIRANMNCNVFLAWRDEEEFDKTTINDFGFQTVPGQITCSNKNFNLKYIAKKEVQNGETITLKQEALEFFRFEYDQISQDFKSNDDLALIKERHYYEMEIIF